MEMTKTEKKKESKMEEEEGFHSWSPNVPVWLFLTFFGSMLFVSVVV